MCYLRYCTSSNAFFKLNKLLRHLGTNHNECGNKIIDFFLRKRDK